MATEYKTEHKTEYTHRVLIVVPEETVVAFLPSVTALRLVSAGRTNWEIST
jgi:hypothetical protein